MTSLALLFPFVLLSAAPRKPPAADTVPPTWRYTLRYGTTVTRGTGRPKTTESLLAMVTASGATARLEVLEGNKDFKRGEVVITTDSGRTLQILEPGKRRYREMSLAELEAKTRGKLTLSVRNSRVEVLPEARVAGPDGASQVHGRLTHDFTLTAKMLVFSHTSVVRQEIDHWVDPRHEGLTNPIAGFFRGVEEILVGEGIREVRRRELALLRGEPVRTITATTSRAGDGQQEVEITTLELLEITRVDHAVLESTIPAGYTRR